MARRENTVISYDVNDSEIRIGDKVAYPQSRYGGYRTSVHTGVVKHITDCGIWILPDDNFVENDASKKKKYPISGYRNSFGRDIPVYDYSKGTKTEYYDLCWKYSHRCMKL